MMTTEVDQDTAVYSLSPLPHLGLVLASPSLALAPYVHSYWFINRVQARPLLLEEYLYPEGGVGIIFNSGDPIIVDGTAVTAPAFLDGTNSFRKRLGFCHHITAVGIRFRPGGAYSFLPVALKEVQNLPLDLDLMMPMPPVLAGISERLAALPTLHQKITQLEVVLRHWHKPERELSAEVRLALAAINQARGQVSVKALADAGFISQRQLERLFQVQVGMSAKTYARLVRVRSARALLRQGLPVAAAHFAQELGFYDQAHFIHDFQTIMGLTPQQYRRNRALRQQKWQAERLNEEVGA